MHVCVKSEDPERISFLELRSSSGWVYLCW